MKLVYADAKQIKNIFKTLNVLHSEPVLEFNYEGLTSQIIDPSHVAMIKLNLSKECFDEYKVDQPLKTCFDLEDLVKKVFRNTNNNDMLKLTVKDDKATFTLVSDLNRNFKMSTLEPSVEELPEPKINYNVTVKLTLKAVDRILKDLKGLTQQITLMGDKEKITFSAKLEDGESYNVSIDNYNENLLKYINNAGHSQKAKFGIDNLIEIIKALKPLTDIIEISFSQDLPLRIRIDIGYRGTLTYWLAPRIES